MSGISGGELTVDIIATRIPPEVANPHGRNSFALDDGIATPDPGYAKRASVVDVEAQGERSPGVVERETYPPPTEEEAKTLRKVAGSIPATAYLLCIVEFSERASYYGVQTIFSNFMQFPLPAGGPGTGAVPPGTEETAGALGKGEQFSVAFGLVFTFLAYLIPIYGAWVADAQLGRYKVILIGVLICGVAHIIMICGAIPSVLQAGKGIAPFMISLFTLAIGAGLFKPNVAPTILDQYQHQRPWVKTLKSGEKVIVDPETTIQRIMLLFYALVNVGAFYALATTYAEKYIGYWLAFLLPGIIYFLLPSLLWYLNNKLIKRRPDGSVLGKVWKISTMAIKKNKLMFWKADFWDAAKPSVLAQSGTAASGSKEVYWTDKDVDDVRRTMTACAIFLYFPIYNINDGGIGSVSTSQGAAMYTGSAPNDLLNNFNPLAIIVTIPILSYVVYPALRKYNIKFGRIDRITVGFICAILSGVAGSLIQWKIYDTSPCGYYASNCTVGNEVSPISIWAQISLYTLGAWSECFANVTAYELAYARSPEGMKALTTAIFLLMNALASALGLILTPAIVDPHLIWVWAGPTIALTVQTVIFYFRYRKFNDDDFMIYEEKPTFSDKDLFHEEHAGVPETISEEAEIPDNSEKTINKA
ncbi:peptide transporter ptr2 [Recurvomyces mirabilis]|uniref:peptide transporter ptr2 n=1 Tax=Recurvomyces mirabilis TaxID=574656 RepID=UPI002DE03E27|nr:peptide transporter ptr2 [Recurvomyces mirabilis]